MHQRAQVIAEAARPDRALGFPDLVPGRRSRPGAVATPERQPPSRGRPTTSRHHGRGSTERHRPGSMGRGLRRPGATHPGENDRDLREPAPPAPRARERRYRPEDVLDSARCERVSRPSTCRGPSPRPSGVRRELALGSGLPTPRPTSVPVLLPSNCPHQRPAAVAQSDRQQHGGLEISVALPGDALNAQLGSMLAPRGRWGACRGRPAGPWVPPFRPRRTPPLAVWSRRWNTTGLVSSNSTA